MNHLSNNFYTCPTVANATFTTKQLRETMLATGGWIMACGHMFDIVSKHLGAGVHRISLVEANRLPSRK